MAVRLDQPSGAVEDEGDPPSPATKSRPSGAYSTWSTVVNPGSSRSSSLSPDMASTRMSCFCCTRQRSRGRPGSRPTGSADERDTREGQVALRPPVHRREDLDLCRLAVARGRAHCHAGSVRAEGGQTGRSKGGAPRAAGRNSLTTCAVATSIKATSLSTALATAARRPSGENEKSQPASQCDRPAELRVAEEVERGDVAARRSPRGGGCRSGEKTNPAAPPKSKLQVRDDQRAIGRVEHTDVGGLSDRGHERAIIAERDLKAVAGEWRSEDHCP